MEAIGPYALPDQFRHDDRWNEPPIGPDYAPPLAPQYFNWRKISIYGGSNEIQKNIIAKAILGLVTISHASVARAWPGLIPVNHRHGCTMRIDVDAPHSAGHDGDRVSTGHMDFELSEEQRLLKDSVERLIARSATNSRRAANT